MLEEKQPFDVMALNPAVVAEGSGMATGSAVTRCAAISTVAAAKERDEKDFMMAVVELWPWP